MQSLIFYKKLIFSAILAVFIVPVGIFAVEEFDIANPPKPPAIVSVSEKGEVKIQNGVVFHIISNTFFIRTNWDNVYIRWTVRTDGNTKIVKRFNGSASFSEIKLGHIVNIDGVLVSGAESMDMKASFIRDLSLENEEGDFSGTITNISSDSKTLTLKTKNKKELKINILSDTFIKKGNVTITSPDIKKGDVILRLKGVYHQPTETVKAQSLEIYQDRKIFAPRNFQGKLKSLSSVTLPTNAVVTVGGVDYTVILNDKSEVLNNKKANTKLNRFVEGDVVRFYGSIREGAETTVDAELIRNLDL